MNEGEWFWRVVEHSDRFELCLGFQNPNRGLIREPY
jgi:hypothetical protein